MWVQTRDFIFCSPIWLCNTKQIKRNSSPLFVVEQAIIQFFRQKSRVVVLLLVFFTHPKDIPKRSILPGNKTKNKKNVMLFLRKISSSCYFSPDHSVFTFLLNSTHKAVMAEWVLKQIFLSSYYFFGTRLSFMLVANAKIAFDWTVFTVPNYVPANCQLGHHQNCLHVPNSMILPLYLFSSLSFQKNKQKNTKTKIKIQNIIKTILKKLAPFHTHPHVLKPTPST